MSLRAVAWATVEEMDEALLDACNSTVGKNDTLYHLGDFGMADPARYRARIICKDVRLIWGNHDTLPDGGLAGLFHYYWDVHEVKIADTPCWLAHYAHFVWPKSHYGSLHLYGHSHGQREATLDTLMPERRSMDVGVDNVMRLVGSPRPLSEVEIAERLLSRQGHDPVEFYRE